MSANRTLAEFKPSAVVLNSDDSTPVYAGAAVVRGFWVNATFSAHACEIKNGSTTVFTIPASTAPGWYPLGDVVFNDSLVYDPDNAASAGSVTFVYKEADGEVI